MNPTDTSRNLWLRLGLVLAVLIALALSWRLTGIGETLDVAALAAWFDRPAATPLKLAAIVGVYLIGHLVAVPFTLILAATVLVLEPPFAVLCGWLGGVLGATLMFGIGKAIGPGLPERLGGERLAGLDRRIAANGTIAAFWLHVIPIAPATVINLVLGASRLGLRDFVVGSAAGILPITLAVVLLTDRVRGVVEQPSPVQLLWLALVIAAVAGLVALARWGVRRWWGA